MRLLAALFWYGVALAMGSAVAKSEAPNTLDSVGLSQNIILGFVGGFVRNDDLHHPEVQLAERLREAYGDTVTVRVFGNWHRGEARRAIFVLLDKNRDGLLSGEERKNARIVLFGHSWGASAAISLAKELQHESIPVLLTVQIDSIEKIGQNDAIIPTNVSRAINFYQKRGIFHGREIITAANPSQTQVLGNVLLDYRNKPVACQNIPWYDRFLFKDHIKIECDSEVWSRVEKLIRGELNLDSSQQRSDTINSTF